MTTQAQIDEAEKLYRQGNLFRQQNDWQHALECYNQAIELNSDSPAVKAKEMLNSILNYYCKDLFNP